MLDAAELCPVLFCGEGGGGGAGGAAGGAAPAASPSASLYSLVICSSTLLSSHWKPGRGACPSRDRSFSSTSSSSLTLTTDVEPHRDAMSCHKKWTRLMNGARAATTRTVQSRISWTSGAMILGETDRDRDVQILPRTSGRHLALRSLSRSKSFKRKHESLEKTYPCETALTPLDPVMSVNIHTSRVLLRYSQRERDGGRTGVGDSHDLRR